MLFRSFTIIGILILLMTSCYVTHPRYSTIDEVMQVEMGMPFDSVNTILQAEPYDLLKRDSATVTYIYKYRHTNIKRVPRAMKRNKGLEVEGQFRDLVLTFNSSQLVTEIYTKKEDVETSMKKRDIDYMRIFESVTTFLSITLPSILVYLSIQ